MVVDHHYSVETLSTSPTSARSPKLGRKSGTPTKRRDRTQFFSGGSENERIPSSTFHDGAVVDQAGNRSLSPRKDLQKAPKRRRMISPPKQKNRVHVQWAIRCGAAAKQRDPPPLFSVSPPPPPPPPPPPLPNYFHSSSSFVRRKNLKRGHRINNIEGIDQHVPRVIMTPTTPLKEFGEHFHGDGANFAVNSLTTPCDDENREDYASDEREPRCDELRDGEVVLVGLLSNQSDNHSGSRDWSLSDCSLSIVQSFIDDKERELIEVIMTESSTTSSDEESKAKTGEEDGGYEDLDGGGSDLLQSVSDRAGVAVFGTEVVCGSTLQDLPCTPWVKLQASIRRHQTKQRWNRQQRAVLYLQAWGRAQIARKRYRRYIPVRRIQAVVRGYWVRREIETYIGSVIIQSSYRRHSVQKQMQRREQAARQLQKVARGRLSRRRNAALLAAVDRLQDLMERTERKMDAMIACQSFIDGGAHRKIIARTTTRWLAACRMQAVVRGGNARRRIYHMCQHLPVLRKNYPLRYDKVWTVQQEKAARVIGRFFLKIVTIEAPLQRQIRYLQVKSLCTRAIVSPLDCDEIEVERKPAFSTALHFTSRAAILENLAAARIQTRVRSWFMHSRYQKIISSATRIQPHVKGWCARNRYRCIGQASRTIQRSFRFWYNSVYLVRRDRAAKCICRFFADIVPVEMELQRRIERLQTKHLWRDNDLVSDVSPDAVEVMRKVSFVGDMRGLQSRTAILRHVAAARIQSLARLLLERRRYSVLRRSLSVVQLYVKGWYAKRGFSRMIASSLKIQFSFRRWYYQVYLVRREAASRTISRFFTDVVPLERAKQKQIERLEVPSLRPRSIVVASAGSDCVEIVRKAAFSEVYGGNLLQSRYRTLRCVSSIRIQAFTRSVFTMVSYSQQRESAERVQPVLKGWCARQRWRRICRSALAIQALFRGHTARAELQRRRQCYRDMIACATRLQAVLRGLNAQSKLKTCIHAVVALQSAHRRQKCNSEYQLLLRATLICQRFWRHRRSQNKSARSETLKIIQDLQSNFPGWYLALRRNDSSRAKPTNTVRYQNSHIDTVSRLWKSTIVIQSYVRMTVVTRRRDIAVKAAIAIQSFARQIFARRIVKYTRRYFPRDLDNHPLTQTKRRVFVRGTLSDRARERRFEELVTLQASMKEIVRREYASTQIQKIVRKAMAKTEVSRIRSRAMNSKCNAAETANSRHRATRSRQFKVSRREIFRNLIYHRRFNPTGQDRAARASEITLFGRTLPVDVVIGAVSVENLMLGRNGFAKTAAANTEVVSYNYTRPSLSRITETSTTSKEHLSVSFKTVRFLATYDDTSQKSSSDDDDDRSQTDALFNSSDGLCNSSSSEMGPVEVVSFHKEEGVRKGVPQRIAYTCDDKVESHFESHDEAECDTEFSLQSSSSIFSSERVTSISSDSGVTSYYESSETDFYTSQESSTSGELTGGILFFSSSSDPFTTDDESDLFVDNAVSNSDDDIFSHSSSSLEYKTDTMSSDNSVDDYVNELLQVRRKIKKWLLSGEKMVDRIEEELELLAEEENLNISFSGSQRSSDR